MSHLVDNWPGQDQLKPTRLQTVHISSTGIQEIEGSAFAGCSQLQCIKLSYTLRRIGRELQEV